MKRLIIVLLLAIFSAQSLGTAAGINVLDASRGLAQIQKANALRGASPAMAASIDTDIEGLKIFSIAEELSDYVTLEPGLPSLRYQAPSIPTATWIPASAILPKTLPPPRS